jgi:tagaturonate reductase
LSSGIAFLSGIDTVKNAMTNEQIKNYIEVLMAIEISPAIPYQVTEEQTSIFSKAVIDRFANPSIEHLWLNITFQYTMKMKIRILPLLTNYYAIFNKVPEHIALGFAAYLLFMRVDKIENGKYYGTYNRINYVINDDSVSYFHQQLTTQGNNYVTSVLNDVDFWKLDLNLIDGLIDAVNEKYNLIIKDGMATALHELSLSKINVA